MPLEKPVVVQKYGGSSVADVEKIRAVARRVIAAHKRGFHVVAVVSAMGQSTDELLALAKQVTPSPKKRELDMLLSVGERITMSLLTMAIEDQGCEAISLTGSQSGIITSDNHANARIIDVKPVRVLDELAKGRIVIVAGYQGMSYKREVTTLGRGGSDTTAVALAWPWTRASARFAATWPGLHGRPARDSGQPPHPGTFLRRDGGARDRRGRGAQPRRPGLRPLARGADPAHLHLPGGAGHAAIEARGGAGEPRGAWSGHAQEGLRRHPGLCRSADLARLTALLDEQRVPLEALTLVPGNPDGPELC